MRVQSIRLKNFKRFTDLAISEIPESARLIVVVGPNGCGKSSLFDAFLQWYRGRAGFGVHTEEAYFRKDKGIDFGWHDTAEVTLHNGATPQKGSLYVRTAYRNDPDFNINGISRLESPAETIRLSRLIENDQTVSDNYRRLVYETTAAVYDTANDDKSVRVLRQELIGDVRESMRRVFGDLLLNNISDPLGEGAFFFEKGTVGSYHYKNLSGGEKAAFDLLLDVHVKRRYFKDAIYCIDELETHLHTRVQGKVLRELTRVLPEPCQLWVTTHSLGVLRAALEEEVDRPGSVEIIDFDGVDPDVPRELVPSSLGRVSWEKWLSIALDDLSQRIAPRVIVVCEGSAVGTRRKDFDAEIYNRILGSCVNDVVFMSGGSASQVATTSVSVQDALRQVVPSARVVALVDRDDRSEEEVKRLEVDGTLVLPLRHLECYLFADEVLDALAMREGKPDLAQELRSVRATAIANSVARGHPLDDVKSAAGEIYNNVRRVLGLTRSGQNADAFMRDTLAPLVRPGMDCHAALKRAILDRIQ